MTPFVQFMLVIAGIIILVPVIIGAFSFVIAFSTRGRSSPKWFRRLQFVCWNVIWDEDKEFEYEDSLWTWFLYNGLLNVLVLCVVVKLQQSLNPFVALAMLVCVFTPLVTRMFVDVQHSLLISRKNGKSIRLDKLQAEIDELKSKSNP